MVVQIGARFHAMNHSAVKARTEECTTSNSAECDWGVDGYSASTSLLVWDVLSPLLSMCTSTTEIVRACTLS